MCRLNLYIELISILERKFLNMNQKESILNLTNNNDIVKYFNVRKDPIDLQDKNFSKLPF